MIKSAAAPMRRIGEGEAVACYFAVIFVAAMRLYFSLNLLPVPTGDSILFLEPIYNYCHNGKLLSHLLPIDPAGQDRFVWHGPLTPLFYRFLAPSCDLHALYLIRWLAFLPIPIALLNLAQRNIISRTAFFVVSLFCLAIVERVQFRPESLALPFMVLAYWSLMAKRPALEAFFGTCVFLCTPVGGMLYGLLRILLAGIPRPAEWKWLAMAILLTVVIVFWLYPFGVMDWIAGIRGQANMYAQRGSEGLNRELSSYLHQFFTYDVRNDFLPIWSLPLAVLAIGISLKNKKYLIALPFFWYFGLRVPATYYNLVPATVATLLLGYPLLSSRWRTIVMSLMLASGILGIAQLTLRDAVSLDAYPDSFKTTQSTIANLLLEKANIVTAPSFVVFTNPELGSIAGKEPQGAGQDGRPKKTTLIYAAGGSRGRGGNLCPDGTVKTGGAGQKRRLFLFNSTSSWATDICVSR